MPVASYRMAVIAAETFLVLPNVVMMRSGWKSVGW